MTDPNTSNAAEAEPAQSAVVHFGRPVTQEDLDALKSVTDVVEALTAKRIDEDHIHRP